MIHWRTLESAPLHDLIRKLLSELLRRPHVLFHWYGGDGGAIAGAISAGSAAVRAPKLARLQSGSTPMDFLEREEPRAQVLQLREIKGVFLLFFLELIFLGGLSIVC